MIKICTKCKVEQSVTCFSKDKNKKDGYRPICKNCDKKRSKQYIESNKEGIAIKKKQWCEANKCRISIRDKKRYEENKELIAIKNKQYRKKNKEGIAIKKKQRYEENKELISIKSKQYRQTPIGKAVKANNQYKRRSITKQGKVLPTEILELQQSTTHCFWCEVPLHETGSHIDHFVPLSKGGEHELYNLVISCPTCNLRKGAKDPLEFAKIIFKEENK